MRKFVIASVVSAAAALSFAAAANAETVIVKKTTMHHPMHRHMCKVTTTKHRDHRGHWVVKKTRVCR